MTNERNRSGRYLRQPTGYSSFMPAPLPPDPPVHIDDEMLELLSRADRALGRLDGSTEALPNPDLFVLMYVRKEALLSSQIEGTQASLAEVLELEARLLDPDQPTDAVDVVNYMSALEYGLIRMENLPLSLRLLCEIHERLMEGTRGGERNPGQFRTSQNWIGPSGCTLNNASFVPPSPDDMKVALADLEVFLHDEKPMPILIKVGLAHAQFETIHPFLDGNGRMGRLLITFLLCLNGTLRRPLLYLSYYFKKNRAEYYDRLQAIRDKGDWEGWLKFMLTGCHQVANEATEIARKIVQLREKDRMAIIETARRSATQCIPLHDRLFDHPIVSVGHAQQLLGTSFQNANRAISQLETLGIVSEMTGKPRNRVYVYNRYLELFDDEPTSSSNP